MFKTMRINTSTATRSSPATISHPNLNAPSAFPQPLNNTEIAYLRNLSIPNTPPSSPKKLSIASADLAEGETFKFGSNATSTGSQNTNAEANAQAFVPRFPEPRREPKLGRGNKRAKQLELLITIWEELEEELEAGAEGRRGRGVRRGRNREVREVRRRSESRERRRRGSSRWERRERVISVAT